MSYEIIQPPFTLNFREMPKQELKAYFAWFQNILPQRLRELGSAVEATPGFEGWRPNCKKESLEPLGEWFAGQVEMRPRTNEELQDIQSQMSMPIEVPDSELTDRTFSLAMDVGMYLSNVLLNDHPTLRWDQQFGSRSWVDYGQPVLVGFGVVPFNPVSMVVTLAYGIASKKKVGRDLRNIYEIWSKRVG